MAEQQPFPIPKCSRHGLILEKLLGEGAVWHAASCLCRLSQAAYRTKKASCNPTEPCHWHLSGLEWGLIVCFEVNFQRQFTFSLINMETLYPESNVNLDCVSALRPKFQVDLGVLCASTPYRPTSSLWKVHSMGKRSNGDRVAILSEATHPSFQLRPIYKKHVQFLP